MLRVDAHHHLWRYRAGEFGWISGEMGCLQRDFLLPELEGELCAAGVSGTVAVQARPSLTETDFLLSLVSPLEAFPAPAPTLRSQRSPALPEPPHLSGSPPVADSPAWPGSPTPPPSKRSPIWGVVGWLPLADAALPRLLERYGSCEALKGVRHDVQEEPAGFLEGEAFHHGIGLLRSRGLVFDLLIRPEQLPETIRFVDRHPQQPFVLDHLGKPAVRNGGLEPWATAIRELARRPQVSCKVSGLLTEAACARWSPAELRPYFDVVLEAFSPERLMFGSDWPVLRLAGSYPQWLHMVEASVSALSATEQAAILGETAARVYRLTPRTAAAAGYTGVH